VAARPSGDAELGRFPLGPLVADVRARRAFERGGLPCAPQPLARRTARRRAGVSVVVKRVRWRDLNVRSTSHERPPQAPRCTICHMAPRSELGQSTVEFALAVVVLFLLVLGVFDFGRAIFMYSNVENAVREGARRGVVEPTGAALPAGWTAADVVCDVTRRKLLFDAPLPPSAGPQCGTVGNLTVQAVYAGTLGTEKWTYANATARTNATGFATRDVGSIAYQSDNASFWQLTATTPSWTLVVPRSVSVTAQYTFEVITPLLSTLTGNPTLHAATIMRVES
jgi:hypothetical protein